MKLNIFRSKQNSVQETIFNKMMYGGGYEQMQKDKTEKKEKKDNFIKELSKRVNGCSLCGSHNIGIRVSEDRDGYDARCYCKDCGHAASTTYMEGGDTPESLKKLFLKWHSENNEFDVIIKAPKVISVIKELGEIANKMDDLEDFDPSEIVKRLRMLEKWSGLNK